MLSNTILNPDFMRRVFTILLFATLSLYTLNANESLNILFYNVENLFDTEDDPNTNDDEFTPQGDKFWNSTRYWNKINNISKTIVATTPINAPEIIGLCEVENETVIKDLVERSPLKQIGYHYFITSSNDKRGIDVALLYKPTRIQPISNESLYVDIWKINRSTTRDILHVTCRTNSGDTLDIYVCHWPSRLGGIKKSDPLREAAATVLKESVGQLFIERESANIIIMGDFNDQSDSPSIKNVLGAKKISDANVAKNIDLVTLFSSTHDGTYKYQGVWEQYDHFIVSGNMINGLGMFNVASFNVCRAPFLLEDDKVYGGKKPFRVNNGYRYQNGYSDHLPILLELEF